jgi:hypothetical protein
MYAEHLVIVLCLLSAGCGAAFVLSIQALFRYPE